jgi:colicin import membrane protein
MAELREDSLLFSLETLMVRERERMALERAEIERKQALAAAARVNAEKQRLEAELRRERELERARLAEQQRMQEHAARLDALRLGEVERARKEAEARAQSEVVAQRHAHERRMTELRLSASKVRDRGLALGSTGLLVLLIPSALFLYFGRVRPQAAELQADSQKLVSAERGRAEEAARLLAQTERERRRLEGELARLTTLPTQREAARPQANFAPAQPKAREPARPGQRKGDPSCKDDSDPLNPCLR